MTPRQPILGVFSCSKVFVKSHTNFGISQFYTYHLWYVPAKRGIFIYQKWYLCTKIGITYVPKMVFIPILVLTLLARYAFCTHKTPSC